MKQISLVIYRSSNGRDNWEPIGPDSVPEFVRRPEVMGRLVAGEACMDCAEGVAGSDWYRASRVVSKREQDAIKKRETRAAKRRMH